HHLLHLILVFVLRPPGKAPKSPPKIQVQCVSCGPGQTEASFAEVLRRVLRHPHPRISAAKATSAATSGPNGTGHQFAITWTRIIRSKSPPVCRYSPVIRMLSARMFTT